VRTGPNFCSELRAVDEVSNGHTRAKSTGSCTLQRWSHQSVCYCAKTVARDLHCKMLAPRRPLHNRSFERIIREKLPMKLAKQVSQVAHADAPRERVLDLVNERYGEVTAKTVTMLAVDARLSYTTLARYLLYPQDRATQKLRRSTLRSIAFALDVRPDWLDSGVGTQQLAFWPALLPTDTEDAGDPIEHVTAVVQMLDSLKSETRLRACRAAVAAMLTSVSGAGEVLPPEAYRRLMHLDALHREPPLGALASEPHNVKGGDDESVSLRKDEATGA
jgi:hypothetical protein